MACIRADLDMDAVWAEADERERRVFVENLLAWIKVFPDHLEVKVVGSPPINVLLSEVGLKVPENVGVGEATSTISDWRLERWGGCVSAPRRQQSPTGGFSYGLTAETLAFCS